MVIVTKHGWHVAKLVDEASPTMGSIVLVTERDEDYFSTGDRWDADRPSAARRPRAADGGCPSSID